MTEPLASCRSCGELVFAGATNCSACGYDIGRHNQLRLAFGIVGMLLTMTVVLSPIGLPMLGMAHRHRRLASGSVTTYSKTPLSTHLTSVLRYHLDLERAKPPEFTRGGRSFGLFDRPPEL